MADATSVNDAFNQVVQKLGTAPWLWRYACMYGVWFVFMMMLYGIHGAWNVGWSIFYPFFTGLAILELVALIAARLQRQWSWLLLIAAGCSAGLVFLCMIFIIVSAIDGWGGVYIGILVVQGVFFNLMGILLLISVWKNNALEDAAQ